MIRDMAGIDIELLLQEKSPEQPSGEDLEYDPDFTELERLGQSREEQQFGDTIVPAEEPNWRDVRKQALVVLERTHDLRAGVYLARALTHTDGMAGLRDGLALLRGYLERYWETVHPQLDPDDDNDPTMRVNILAQVCDRDTMLRSIRTAPIVSSRALGRFSLHDVQVATGELPAPAGTAEPPQMSAIEGAFTDCDLEELTREAEAVGAAREHAAAIEQVLTEKVGASQAPDLSDLGHVLKAIEKVMGDQLARRGVAVAPSPEEAAAGGEGGGAAAAAAGVPGQIRSRDDVMRVLDRVIEYFEQHEPSSPIPLLIRRAKKLVPMSFVEIMRELGPEALAQLQRPLGIQDPS